jgi:hypothetical protein
MMLFPRSDLRAPFGLAFFARIFQRAPKALGIEIGAVDRRAWLLPPRLIDSTRIDAIESEFINQSQHHGLGALVIARDRQRDPARSACGFSRTQQMRCVNVIKGFYDRSS